MTVLSLAALELAARRLVDEPPFDRQVLWRVFGAEGFAERERSQQGLSSIDRLAALLEEDAARAWRLRPSVEVEGEALDPVLGRSWSVQTSPEGLRGPALADLPEGELRILALGGAGTFGWGVEEDQAWPARLEEALDQGASVLNLGVPGYTVAQARQHLAAWSGPLAPDVVILAIEDAESRHALRTDLQLLAPRTPLPRARTLRLLRHAATGPWAQAMVLAGRANLLRDRLPVDDFARELALLAESSPRTILVDLCAPTAWRARLAELTRVRRDMELVRYGAAHGEMIDGCLPTATGHSALAVLLAAQLEAGPPAP